MVSAASPRLLVPLGFLIVVAYIPGWTGAAIPSSYFALMIILPILLWLRDIEITSNHLFGGLFVLYAGISVLWSISVSIGFFAFLHQVLVLGLVFCLGSTLLYDDLKRVIIGLAAGLSISAILAIQQWISFKFGYVNFVFANHTVIAGLFVNSNVLCEISAIMLIALLVFKLYWWIPIALPGILFVHSRAAILGLLICALIYIAKISKLGVFILICLAGLIGFVTYGYFNSASIYERIDLWTDTLRGLTVFGSGAGSYELRFPMHALAIDTSIARPRYAHNDFLHLIYEYGIAVCLLIPIILNVLKVNKDEKYIFICFGTISLFSFPLFSPVSAFVGILVAGYLTRYYAPGWNIRVVRRPVLFAGH
mgnify:CR=1 FL=1